jgi:hypothetical protein
MLYVIMFAMSKHQRGVGSGPAACNLQHICIFDRGTPLFPLLPTGEVHVLSDVSMGEVTYKLNALSFGI